MYDSFAQQLLPIEAAILEALNMVPSASKALDMLIDNLEPSGARIAYRLGSRLRGGEMFGDRDLEDLESLLQPILAEIEGGWVSEVIADEHCPGGAWINWRLTGVAAELDRQIKPLVSLMGSLRQIRNLKRADQIARRLCEQATC